MNNLLNVTNAADRAAVIQTNFERLDDVATNLKHVNVTTVTINSADGETSLLESPFTILAGVLKVGDRIRIEAFKNSTDDDGPPNLTLRLKIGTTMITTSPTALGNTGYWNILGLAIVRSVGAAGEIQALFKFYGDGMDLVDGVNANDTRDTTDDLLIDITAEIDGNSNNFNCKQLTIRVER